ncbi:MAG: hypothetical protein R2852_05525 [Bacteroidia bacterium]
MNFSLLNLFVKTEKVGPYCLNIADFILTNFTDDLFIHHSDFKDSISVYS